MPPSKVCPQCETIVPLRLKVCKSCQHVFRAKIKAEHNLPDKACESYSQIVSNQLLRLKQKARASETSEQTVHRQQQNTEHMAYVREDMNLPVGQTDDRCQCCTMNHSSFITDPQCACAASECQTPQELNLRS